MLRDVFYFNQKPNTHPREKFAESLEDARQQCTTDSFWIINEFCDYRGFDWDFDFEFLPDEDVWAEEHNNVWPSQHQKDSGTWLCPKEHSDIIIYRGDVNPVIRRNINDDDWVELDLIDHSKFDFSWHPDPTDPPYIYKWGCKYFPAQLKHVLEYRVPGATTEKYMSSIVELLPAVGWTEHQEVDKNKFDMSWRPDPREPPFIYVWGNKWIDATVKPTLSYHAPGATDKKFMSELLPVLPEWDRWVEVQNVDKNNFDFSWRPDPREPAYIYTWGNKWVDAAVFPTLEYHCDDATDRKYMGNDVPVLPEKDRWVEHQEVDKNNFDFSWRPAPNEPAYIYIWGNKWVDARLKPTLVYQTPGATDKKYMSDDVPVLPEWDRWVEHQEVDKTKFDMSWRPDPREPAYIYTWGNKWVDAETRPTLEYHCDGATDRKYMGNDAPVLPEWDRWVEHQEVDKTKFDMSWRPDPREPAYVYTWGNKWVDAASRPTLEYHCDDATDRKYMGNDAPVLPEWDRWEVHQPIDQSSFDFTWRPDPKEPPFTYVFGNELYDAVKMPTVMYNMPEGSVIKYVDFQKAKLVSDASSYEYLEDSYLADLSWVPDPDAPPYIYAWGNQWNKPEDKISIQYVVPGATEYVYMEERAVRKPCMDNWYLPENVDTSGFDFSWEPHPKSPPYIYQFATRLDDIWVDDGPKYVTPGNDGFVVRMENSILSTGKIEYPRYTIETTLDELVKKHPTEQFWALNKNINYDDFDFSWRPDKDSLFNVTVFGSPESERTHTYFVNAKFYLQGYTDLDFIQSGVELDDKYLAKIFVKPDLFFVDRGNTESATRFETLKTKFGMRIQKTRYLNSWVDTINRCTNRATTEMIWILNSELDYDDFDFEYYPNPWQMKMVQVFGTQWSHWGTTFMVNCETFKEDTKYINIIEHLSNLNFVKTTKAKATACVHDVVMVDHGNSELRQVSVQVERQTARKLLATIPYDESYLNTLKNFIKQLPAKKEHYLWICSSICNYSQFDFTYVCDPFSRNNLHVFPSDTQKFGDTFFIDVNKTKEIIDELEKLEEYHKINFNGATRSSRLPAPLIFSSDDMHMNSLDKITGFPYATIIADDNMFMDAPPDEPMNLWSPETKNIIITSTGATRIIVPAEAKDIVKKELYDYPYVKRMSKLTKSEPLDIVFVSNGETVAEQNYEHLLKFTDGLRNKIHRVDGINGRTEALHAAAESSKTPWFFCIPAKLFVNKKFDWSYQADRMQQPKHYIFNALNPVNDLCYGHQSMVLYNKNLVLGNEGVGLDFTLDSLHMSVDLISGTVLGDTDEYSTWRTAFREAVKLKCYSETGDAAAITRLDVWTSVGKGSYGEWSIKGALDGIEFYDEAGGELAVLRQSYYWDWLKARYESKY